MTMDCLELENRIKKCSRLYIYGSGIVAYGVYKAIQKLFIKETDSFVVSDKHTNPSTYTGLEVIDVSDFSVKMTNDDLVIVATPPEYHKGIEKTLNSITFMNYILLTPDLEYELMGSYLKMTEGITCIEDIICKTDTITKDIKVFMAVSHNDKQLLNEYTEEEYVTKIQVGKAYTDIIIDNVKCFDDYNENISILNPLYGELTATYNIWKNYQHEIMGLFHYRRILDVNAEKLAAFDEDKVDVILPLPFVCYPDASGQYGRYLCSEDIEIMKDVVFEQYPELKDEVMACLKGHLLYNYNMLIARKEVFIDYCQWIFPLLEEITNRCEKYQRERQTRYIGRIGEVLTSVYFTLNNKNWKITHAPKIWRV